MRSVHYRILRSHKDTPHGPSDRIRTCGIVVPNHARYQLRYTRVSSEETRSVPFPPGGENCTCAPSFFLSKSDPLRWAPIR